MKIYINVKSLDKILLNIYIKFLTKSLKSLKITNFKIQNLPKVIKRITLLKSPHVNKKAMEQFELRIFKKILVFKISEKSLSSVVKFFLINKPKSIKLKMKRE
jgi:small subunit ribosomal protein S10